jgi:hypothetical protein
MTHTAETKARIAASMKGKKNALGTRRTPKQRAAMAAAQAARRARERNRPLS